MNFYFYCPKEDIFHRKNWRKAYPKNWLQSFKNFCEKAKKLNIKIIVGISPGLDFDYNSYINGKKDEIKSLIKKLKLFYSNGATFTAILFDDIETKFKKEFQSQNEGQTHAKIVNEIYSLFNGNIFAVPRIYSDELVNDNPIYLNNFIKSLDKEIFIFFCGKHIVYKTFTTNLNVIQKKVTQKKIVYWDNFYANDYCPNKLIIGPWKNKKLINKSMINGTGKINTDCLILEIVNKTGGKKNAHLIWKEILLRYNVPKEFLKVKKFFLSPIFSNETKIKNIFYNINTIDILDKLFWEWKSDLSQEWYSYILNFKHDLQILKEELSLNRILKTQTHPLQKVLTNRRRFK